MERFLDKIKKIFKIKEEINPDGRYIVYDMAHENYSPERLLYARNYLKKFSPEILEIDGKQKLVIIIDSNYDYMVLSNYVCAQNEYSTVNMVKDSSFDERVSGCVFLS